jgi:hypothetical protein
MKTKRVLRSALLLLGVFAAACGELTLGGSGEVEVYARSDPAAQTSLQGLLTAELRVYLFRDATGDWLEVTDGVRDQTLDLRVPTERRVAVRFLPEGRYSRVRIVFQRVEANVTSGLSVPGTYRVDVGAGGSVTVEREAAVEVVASRGFDMILDLNSTTWLASASSSTRTVSATAFRNAIAVRVR